MYANLSINKLFDWHDGKGNVNPREINYTLHFSYQTEGEPLVLTAVTNETGHSIIKGSSVWEDFSKRNFALIKDELTGEKRVFEIGKSDSHG